jgi:hypothetical protein
MIAKSLAALTAAVLIATPAAATSTDHTASLSVSHTVRAGTASSKKSELTGGTVLVAVPLAAVAAYVAYHIFIKGEDDRRETADSN